jgi:RNA polymerase sigma-70 factor (ECF subfamily)
MSAYTAESHTARTVTESKRQRRSAAPTPSHAAKRGAERRLRSVPARERSRAAARSDESRASSPAEFNAEVLPHRDELYASALRMTRHPQDAEDLVQETFIRAFTAWARFVPGSNCRAWLFRILTNSFINNYRRRRRHNRFQHENRRRRRHNRFQHENPEDAVAAIYGPAHRRSKTPQEELCETALGDEVSAALDTLGEDYRKVVELADLQGVRYRDIAEKLGVPIGTVMSRLFRARRQLESQLEEFAASDYGIRRAVTA